MGFTFRFPVSREKAAQVEAVIAELFAWVEVKGGYDHFYLPWRLANHLTVVHPEHYKKGDSTGQYIGVDLLQPGEVLVFHHDVPWLWQLPPEVLAKAKECFEKHDVVQVWWAIVKENGAGTDLIDRLWPEIEKVKEDLR